MSSTPISPALRTWYRWKALRLPWRSKFLIGLDLNGNTYWEFRNRGTGPAAAATADGGRWRRIVQYPSATHHGDVSVPPQWHQWLRHARRDPPSLHEQRQDLTRLEQIKVLASQADARWAAKERLVVVDDDGGAPGGRLGQRVPPLAARSARGAVGASAVGQAAATDGKPTGTESSLDEGGRGGDAKRSGLNETDPWKRARGGPSENWQPKAWTPTTKK